MPPIRKRNTRSSTILNEKTTTNTSSSTSSIQEGLDDQVCMKQTRSKPCLAKKKQLLSEQVTGLLVEEMITDPPGRSTFTMLQPVPFDEQADLHDSPASPPPLIIDTEEDTISSQLFYVNHGTNNQLNKKNTSSGTPFENNKTKERLSNNVARSNFVRNLPININDEEVSTTIKTTSINRTPTVDRTTFNNHSQVSNQSIVVSVDQSPQNSNEENTYNRRTSTPLCPSRRQQVNKTLVGVRDDSFSIDFISPETYEVLSRFPEFRKLVKAYSNEQQTCQTWVNDYARLQQRYQQLQENSFPRPSATALSYLLDLVTQIQRSSGRDDPRSDEQLARDLGVSEIVLMTLKDPSPQQTGLNLFNHFYPGYSTKVNLGSINKLDVVKPGLLESVLVFSQRAAPGVRYTKEELREALNNSIRGARYQSRKAGGGIPYAVGLANRRNADRGDSRRDASQIADHHNPIEQTDMEVDQFM